MRTNSRCIRSAAPCDYHEGVYKSRKSGRCARSRPRPATSDERLNAVLRRPPSCPPPTLPNASDLARFNDTTCDEVRRALVRTIESTHLPWRPLDTQHTQDGPDRLQCFKIRMDDLDYGRLVSLSTRVDGLTCQVPDVRAEGAVRAPANTLRREHRAHAPIQQRYAPAALLLSPSPPSRSYTPSRHAGTGPTLLSML